MADQIANTIDWVDIFMLKLNEKEEYEASWTVEKKKNYAEKALAVSRSCFAGIKSASVSERSAFMNLMKTEEKAYHYTMKKIDNPIFCCRSFFKELDGTTTPQQIALFESIIQKGR